MKNVEQVKNAERLAMHMLIATHREMKIVGNLNYINLNNTHFKESFIRYHKVTK